VTPGRRIAPLIVAIAALAPMASSAAASVTVGTPSVTATENVAFTGSVATFTSDDPPPQIASSYSATIEWGDGTATAATITGSVGTFTVSASGVGHAYAEGGTQTLTVRVKDSVDATEDSAQGTATIADAPLSATGPSALTLAEGAAIGTPVAHFTDTDTGPIPPVSHYSATISWGDGSSSAATVSGAGGAAGYDVTVGPHAFEAGSYPLVVTITDIGGALATVTIPLTVLDAPLSATPAPPIGLGDEAFSGQLATFTDADPGANAAHYSAQILWGDGSASVGTIAAAAGGTFTVTGAHTYAISGTYAVTVLVRDSGGQSAVVQTSLTVVARHVIVCATPAATGMEPVSGPCVPPPGRCIVPRLKGMSLSAARLALVRARCKLGKVTVPRRIGHTHGKPAKPTGPLVVARQSPVAGVSEPADTAVAVRLAPAPRHTPKHRK
jgi:hypothetical protein